MKRFKKLLVLIIIGFIGVEFLLRFIWGFCDSVLMTENKNYEYIAQPNQDRFRFRNHIFYNSHSMRSAEPDSSALKILGFGDSVINGSVMVDQDSVVTSILSRDLSDHSARTVQVLNISAGSWGPDNCFEYLKEKGDFNAKMMFLIASSHDAYDNINFRKVVDHEKGYESSQYNLALWELIDRYAIPRISQPPLSNETSISKDGMRFNTGFGNINEYCKDRDIPFFIYLHPDSIELSRREFNLQGKEILTFCKNENIPVFYSFDINMREDYRDIIHLKESGHRHIAAFLKSVMEGILPEG